MFAIVNSVAVTTMKMTDSAAIVGSAYSRT